jgi:hypothetical protein
MDPVTDGVRSPDMYILCLTLVGSVMLYQGGAMDYMDALFFAAGGATQSGLNTLVTSFLR